MINKKYKYSALTSGIIEAAMKVHNPLGSGFPEVIYQRALAIEFRNRKIPYMREFDMPVFYCNEQIGSRKIDFLVEEKVILELKAIATLESVHLAQVLNYLEAFKIEVALLINFGHSSLQFRRLINSKLP